MQKVEGSSPFIRLSKRPAKGATPAQAAEVVRMRHEVDCDHRRLIGQAAIVVDQAKRFAGG